MKKHMLFTLSTSIAIGTLLLSASPVQAQSGRDTNRYQGREGTRMNAGMDEPHQVLAMAYRDNLVTFARILQRSGNGNTSGTQPSTSAVTPNSNAASGIDKELAKPVVDEMRRAFEKLSDENKEQAKAIKHNVSDSQMTTMKNRMDAQLEAIDSHLDVLEKTVKEPNPDAQLIAQHTSEILKASQNMWVMDTRRASNPPNQK